jgi:opacity protein-like surface antigen
MRKFFHVLCGVAAGLLAAPAVAQESIADSGPYFSFGAGFSDNVWTGTDPLSGSTVDFEYDYSLVGVGALGYAWVPPDSPAGYRLEFEGSYRRTEIDQVVESVGPTLLTAEGYLESIGAMANGYVDFNFGEKTVPYFGGGIGMARVSRRDFVVDGAQISNKYVHTGAWQLMVGVGFRLSPGTVIGLEFRHFELMEFNFDNTPLDQEIKYDEVLLTFRLIG